MKLKCLLEELPGADVDGDREVDLEEIHCDSRYVGQGDLFVAIRGGQERDRHLFIGDALSRGARAVVVEDPVEMQWSDAGASRRLQNGSRQAGRALLQLSRTCDDQCRDNRNQRQNDYGLFAQERTRKSRVVLWIFGNARRLGRR